VLCEQFLPGRHPEDWDLDGLLHALAAIFPVPDDVDVAALGALSREEVIEAVQGTAHEAYAAKEEQFGLDAAGVPIMRDVERQVMLMVIDTSWIHHIDAIDELREGAWLSGIAQRDPLVEFKQRAFEMFQRLQATIRHDIVRFIFGVQIEVHPAPLPTPEPVGAAVASGPAQVPSGDRRQATGVSAVGARDGASQPAGRRPAAAAPAKLPGRNDPCYCGSGIKYKKCHGR
jgi:preprotein translocase subunit SecA